MNTTNNNNTLSLDDIFENDDLFDLAMELVRDVACRNRDLPSDVEGICEECFVEALERLDLEGSWEELAPKSKGLLFEALEDSFYTR